MDDVIIVGCIGAPYGVKGWVKITSYTKPHSNIIGYLPWQIRQNGQWRDVTITAHEAQGKHVMVHIAGCDDRDAAAALTHTEIAIPRQRLPVLAADEGEFYWYELDGLRVINQAGELLGTVDSVMETGTHDVLVVKRDGPMFTIPFVYGEIIIEVNVTAGFIRVAWDPDDVM